MAESAFPLVDMLEDYIRQDRTLINVKEVRNTLDRIVHGVLSSTLNLYHQINHQKPITEWLEGNNLEESTSLVLLEQQATRNMYTALNDIAVLDRLSTRGAVQFLRKISFMAIYACVVWVPCCRITTNESIADVYKDDTDGIHYGGGTVRYMHIPLADRLHKLHKGKQAEHLRATYHLLARHTPLLVCLSFRRLWSASRTIWNCILTCRTLPRVQSSPTRHNRTFWLRPIYRT